MYLWSDNFRFKWLREVLDIFFRHRFSTSLEKSSTVNGDWDSRIKLSITFWRVGFRGIKSRVKSESVFPKRLADVVSEKRLSRKVYKSECTLREPITEWWILIASPQYPARDIGVPNLEAYVNIVFLVLTFFEFFSVHPGFKLIDFRSGESYHHFDDIHLKVSQRSAGPNIYVLWIFEKSRRLLKKRTHNLICLMSCWVLR